MDPFRRNLNLLANSDSWISLSKFLNKVKIFFDKNFENEDFKTEFASILSIIKNEIRKYKYDAKSLVKPLKSINAQLNVINTLLSKGSNMDSVDKVTVQNVVKVLGNHYEKIKLLKVEGEKNIEINEIFWSFLKYPLKFLNT